MSAFTNFLEKLGNDFLKSAMVPAMAFLIACTILFDPLLKVVAAFQDPQATNQLVRFAVMIVILTILVGLTLTALNTLILRIFQGYAIFPPFKFLYNWSARRHQRVATRRANVREALKQQIYQLEDDIRFHDYSETQLERLNAELEGLKDRYYEVAREYSLDYPEKLEQVLPTRLGNIMKAAEDYPASRYGFEGTHLWSRLLHVIPADYKAAIDNARNELSFHVNMSTVSLLFVFLCLMEVSFTAPVLPAFLQENLKYLVTGGVAALSSAFFYNAAIMSANSLGMIIRASSDLFHLDLLKKLEQPKPKDIGETYETWQRLNELIVLGNHSLTFKNLEYRTDDSSPVHTAVHTHNVHVAEREGNNPSKTTPIQVDLGGITMHLDDFLKAAATVLRENAAWLTIKGKSKSSRSGSTNKRKTSSSKNRSGKKKTNRRIKT